MIVSLIFRGVQLLCAIVTLGLSAYLIASYGPGRAPSLISYGAFCGGAGLVIALIGIVAAFIDKLQGIIMLALDAFAAFFLAAGGIAFAVKLKVGNCSDVLYYSGDAFKVFGPSGTKSYDTDSPKKYTQRLLNDTQSRCRISQADTAFVWFMFGAFLVTIVLAFFNRSGRRGAIV